MARSRAAPAAFARAATSSAEPADGAFMLLRVHSVLHQRSGPQSGRERSPSMSTVNTFVPVRPRNGYVTDRS